MKSYQGLSQMLCTITLIGIFFFIPVPAWADPFPDVKVNGADGPITVSGGSNVTVTVQMDAGTALGNMADWFAAQVDPAGNLFSLDASGIWVPNIVSAFQGPLFNSPVVSVYDGPLAEGTHTFYFAVDQTPDGLLTLPPVFDSAAVTVQAASPPVTGDYGDAPDGGATGYPAGFAQTGSFPTLHGNGGARTLATDDAVLGMTASLELDANDIADPDGVANLGPANTDSDDAVTNFFLLLTSIPPPATLSIRVNGPATGSGGDFFVNVLIDLDMNGSWGGAAGNNEPEWVIKNHAVTVTPGVQTTVTPPAFAYANGLLLPDGAWMRIALTKESITAADWDGSGEFSAGEIEDHTISIPDLDGKKYPILTVDCGGPYRFGGAAAIPVTCNVTNLRAVAGNFDWTVARVSGGGVDVTAKAGGPVPIGAAPGPGNVVPVGLTGTRIAGNLPSTWRFTAVPDPEAVVTAGGVILGHGESAVNFDFEDEEAAGEVYVSSVEGGFQHFDGFSEVMGFINIGTDNPEIVAGLSVTVELLLDGEHLETKTVNTDDAGMASVDFTIFQYGNYTVKVLDVAGNSAGYNPENNTMDSTGVVVN